MAVSDSVDRAAWFSEQIGAYEPDCCDGQDHLAEALMSAEVDAVCGAGYGERSLRSELGRAGALLLRVTSCSAFGESGGRRIQPV